MIYEIIATARIRVEADNVREARGEIRGILDTIARHLPTGASFQHADPNEASKV